jgi:hypothetical protein
MGAGAGTCLCRACVQKRGCTSLRGWGEQALPRQRHRARALVSQHLVQHGHGFNGQASAIVHLTLALFACRESVLAYTPRPLAPACAREMSCARMCLSMSCCAGASERRIVYLCSARDEVPKDTQTARQPLILHTMAIFQPETDPEPDALCTTVVVGDGRTSRAASTSRTRRASSAHRPGGSRPTATWLTPTVSRCRPSPRSRVFTRSRRCGAAVCTLSLGEVSTRMEPVNQPGDRAGLKSRFNKTTHQQRLSCQ